MYIQLYLYEVCLFVFFVYMYCDSCLIFVFHLLVVQTIVYVLRDCDIH